MAELTADLDPSKFTIVMDHQPCDYENQKDAGVDLVLSGHTHGGQLCLGRLSPYSIGFEHSYGIRAVRGETRIGPTRLLVCNGIGVSRLPLRVGAPPEILLVRFI